MHNGMRALADLLPNARLRVLERQTHTVKPKALAPVLVDFFGRAEGVPRSGAAMLALGGSGA